MKALDPDQLHLTACNEKELSGASQTFKLGEACFRELKPPLLESPGACGVVASKFGCA